MQVPPHWTAEQAWLFTDFFGHVLEAIWDVHDHAVVEIIIEHERVSGGCRCRLCRPYAPHEDDDCHDPADHKDCYDPADDEDMEDDIPF